MCVWEKTWPEVALSEPHRGKARPEWTPSYTCIYEEGKHVGGLGKVKVPLCSSLTAPSDQGGFVYSKMSRNALAKNGITEYLAVVKYVWMHNNQKFIQNQNVTMLRFGGSRSLAHIALQDFWSCFWTLMCTLSCICTNIQLQETLPIDSGLTWFCVIDYTVWLCIQCFIHSFPTCLPQYVSSHSIFVFIVLGCLIIKWLFEELWRSEWPGHGDIQAWLLAKSHVWILGLQPVSVLKSMVCVVTKGHTNAQGLALNLWPCWYLRAMLSLGLHWCGWPELPQGPRWLLNPTAAKGFVCVHGPAAAGVSVDVCSSWSQGHKNHAWWNVRTKLSWLCLSLVLRKLSLPVACQCNKRAGSDPHARAGLNDLDMGCLTLCTQEK